MQMIYEIATKGDNSTMPGGICLRVTANDEFATHCFSVDADGKRGYFWGHYISDVKDAVSDFMERVHKAARYDRGGSLDTLKSTATIRQECQAAIEKWIEKCA